MTRDEAQAKITQKLAQLPDREAIKVYAALRATVMGARKQDRKPDRATAQAMVLTGNALEARIGSAAFENLMDSVDASVA